MAFGLSNRNLDTVIVMDAILISLACVIIIFAYREISRVPIHHAEEIANAILIATDDFSEDNVLAASSFDETGSIQLGQRYQSAVVHVQNFEPDSSVNLFIDHPVFADLSAEADAFRLGALRAFKSGTTDRAGNIARKGGFLTYRLATPLRAFRDCWRCESAGMSNFKKGDVIGIREVIVPVRNQFGLSGRKLLYATGMLICALLVFIGFILPVFDRDRRERVKMNNRAQSFEQQATTDPLTGLYNRRYFEHSLQNHLEESRANGMPLGLLLLDIDHFKQINDTHGHPWGDVVLKEVALRLLAMSRQSDIVARVGGEEFAVIAPNASMGQIMAIAERYRENIERLRIEVGGAELRPTISIGIATSEHGAEGLEVLVQAADRKLYEAKRGGRNRVAA